MRPWLWSNVGGHSTNGSNPVTCTKSIVAHAATYVGKLTTTTGSESDQAEIKHGSPLQIFFLKYCFLPYEERVL